MGNIKKVCLLFVSTLLFTLFLNNFNFINVSAENVLEVAPTNYETYLNTTIETDAYYQDIDAIIKDHFSSFDVSYTDYENIVLGKSQFRILEITPQSYLGDPNTVSDLASNVNEIKGIYERSITNHNVMDKYFITNLPNFEVEVMTIKQFVDYRKDLKGEYDAIVFAAGDYNPAQVQSCDSNTEDCTYVLNTQGILNDITPLKATEIIEDYVKGGLPVFLHQDIYNYTDSNLYQYFNGLNTTYANIYNLNYVDNAGFYETLAMMAMTQLKSTKPFVEVLSQPTDYYVDQTETYNVGDVVDFEFKLTNKPQANLVLYLDVNQNEQFENDELAYATTITKGVNTFSFEIPQVYTGLLNYRFIFDSGLTSVFEGSLKINSVKQSIKVLNVVSDMVYKKDGLFDQQLYNNYFKYNPDYEVTVDFCKVKDFSKNNGNRFDCSHNTVMDNYDVIFFGQDIFDKPMNVHVYNSIQEQINNGKPVIYSSSISRGHDKWISYFSDDLTFSNYKTDLYQLNNNVDKLQIVNNSSYVAYPYNMNNTNLDVPEEFNYAFNERYQLDLEDAQLVPLLNMYNTSEYRLDRFDSYNNFYYMKTDNVVYLNVGNNTFNKYSDTEHKLLLNAIVNSYITSNATSQKLDDLYYLSINNSYEDVLVDINEVINFSFSVYSSTEQTFNYSVLINDVSIEESTVTNDSLVTVTIDNLSDYVMLNTNNATEVYIQLIVEDSENQTKAYDFTFFAADFKDYVSLMREINGTDNSKYVKDKYIELNKSYTVDYTMNFASLDFTNLMSYGLPETLTLRNITFTDVLPQDLSVTNPNNMYTLSTNEQGDTVITYTFNDITLRLVNGFYVPDRESIQLSIPFTTSVASSYELSSGNISLDGISIDHEDLSFNTVSFESLKGIDSSMVEFTFMDYLYVPFDGTSEADLNSYLAISRDTRISDIIFNLSDNEDYFTITTDEEGINYTLVPTSIGSQNIELVVVDIFGNTIRKPFVAHTYQPINSIILDENMTIYADNTQVPFNIQIDPIVDLNNLQFEVINYNTLNEDVINLTLIDGQYYVEGLIKGTADIIVSGFDQYGNVITEVCTVVVNENNSIEFDKNFLRLLIGETYDITQGITINNINYTLDSITWSTQNPEIATIDSTGVVTAVSPGSAIIEATLPNGDSGLILVKVYDYISEELSGFDDVKLSNANIYAYTTYSLYDFITLVPNNVDLSGVNVVFSMTDPDNVVTFDPTNNTITTLKPGSLTINVTITQLDKDGNVVRTVTDSLQLDVLDRPDPIVDKGDNKY